MRFSRDQLRDKALLALEEIAVECRYQHPPRTALLRFCLAFLWSLSNGDRRPFDRFWHACSCTGMYPVSDADTALNAIHVALGLKRDDELAMALWKKRQEAESEQTAQVPRQRDR